MKQIMRDVTEAKQGKKVAREEIRNKPKVRTEGSYSPNYMPVQVDHSRSQDRQEAIRNDSGSPEEVAHMERVQWVQSPWTHKEDLAGGHMASKNAREHLKMVEQNIKERSKSPPLAQTNRTLNPKEKSPPPIPVSNVPAIDSERRAKGKKETMVPKEEVPKSKSERTDSKGKDLKSPTRTSKEKSFPFRGKKTAFETVPSVEQVGHVKENVKKRQSFEPTSAENKGVSSLSTACHGLPKNGEFIFSCCLQEL